MRTPTPVPRRPRRRRALAAVAGVGAIVTAAAVNPIHHDPTAATSITPPSAIDAARPLTPTSAADHSADHPTVSSVPLSERLLIAASLNEVETAPEPVEAAEADDADVAPEPAAPAEPEPARSVWDRVADCESGEWQGDGGFVTASANWSSTAGLFEGGLQFHPDTWDGYRDPAMPGAAYEASRAQQIAVAERVLDAQGWQAWPVCSRKLGLR